MVMSPAGVICHRRNKLDKAKSCSKLKFGLLSFHKEGNRVVISSCVFVCSLLSFGQVD